MAETTGITWTDRTWNPWMGCSKVSPGCDHCYAERDMTRYGRDFTVLTRAAERTFNGPLEWERSAARKGETLLVFTCSWSDFFHQQAAPWRAEAWEIMRRTPHLTYQVLTKRPGWAVAWHKAHGWLPNVWLGTSVESAKYLPRLDVQERVPAPVRFVSCEPLLGPLDLWQWLIWRDVHWVIAGGESGPGHRPMDLDWVRVIRDQCIQAKIPFHYKQGAGNYPGGDRLLDGRLWNEIPGRTTQDLGPPGLIVPAQER